MDLAPRPEGDEQQGQREEEGHGGGQTAASRPPKSGAEGEIRTAAGNAAPRRSSAPDPERGRRGSRAGRGRGPRRGASRRDGVRRRVPDPEADGQDEDQEGGERGAGKGEGFCTARGGARPGSRASRRRTALPPAPPAGGSTPAVISAPVRLAPAGPQVVPPPGEAPGGRSRRPRAAQPWAAANAPRPAEEAGEEGDRHQADGEGVDPPGRARR